PPALSGRVVAHELQGDIAITHEDLSLKGLLLLNSDIQFNLQNSVLNVERFILDGDFTHLSVHKKDLFNKPKGITLKVSAQGSSRDGRIIFKKAVAELHTLKTTVSGHINQTQGQESDLSF